MGYVQCFKAISQILKRKGIPTVSSIQNEFNRDRYSYDSRYTQYYLNNGGLIEYALSITAIFSDSCKYGDFSESKPNGLGGKLNFLPIVIVPPDSKSLDSSKSE